MKIAHLSTSDLGGAGIAAKNLHLALLKKGYQSSFISKWHLGESFEGFSQLNPPQKKYLQRATNALSTRILPSLHKTPEQLFLSNRPLNLEHFSLPWSELDPFTNKAIQQADIIHLNWVSDGFMDYQKIFKPNRKYVWTLHDMNPFTGGCHHSDGCIKFKTNCNFCYQLNGERNQYLSSTILNYKLKALSVVNNNNLIIVAPSQWLSFQAAQSALLSRFAHKVIPNVIQTEVSLKNRDQIRLEKGIMPEEIIFLFVAHHYDNPRKGIGTLLSALQNLNHHNYKVYVVGNELKKINNPRILQCGYVNNKQQLAELYTMADAFLLPSLAENFPNTIVEALLCGTPVVASNVGGIPEQVNNQNGILVSDLTALGWQQALDNFIAQKINFNRESIKKEAELKYNTDTIINKYTEIYNTLSSS